MDEQRINLEGVVRQPFVNPGPARLELGECQGLARRVMDVVCCDETIKLGPGPTAESIPEVSDNRLGEVRVPARFRWLSLSHGNNVN